MANIRQLYFYFFYKIYKFSESAPSKWMSDLKSSLALDVLILFIFSSILNFYKVLFDPYSHIGEGNLLFIVVISVGLINYYIFNYQDKWKQIVMEFETNKNEFKGVGNWVVVGTILFIILLFIFSFYCYYFWI